MMPADPRGEWLEGGCHCGALRFRVRPRARRVLECNCSICSKKGFLGLIVPADDFEILSGEDTLASYRFHTKVANHRFCPTCGIHPFSRPRSHPDRFDVNLRCLDAGIEGFEVVPFDGQHWEENVAALRKTTSALLLLGCLLSVSGGAGCEIEGAVSGPDTVCREVAAQCVLPEGPLGVCEQMPCVGGATGPCFVCTPQH